MSLKKMYVSGTQALVESQILGAIITFQHRHMPMTISVFDFIFGNRIAARLLSFYGHHVFQADYALRKSNTEYWSGKGSLYWHLWRQHDIPKMGTYPKPVLEILGRGDLTFAEPGFGIGKQTRHLIDIGVLRFCAFLAVEPNDYVRDYMGKHYQNYGFDLRAGSLAGLLNMRFNVPMVNGGVFMYADKDSVDAFFEGLPATGCKYIIIRSDGAPADIIRNDNTTMYAFKPRLVSAGYEDRKFVEVIGANGQYEVFAMV